MTEKKGVVDEEAKAKLDRALAEARQALLKGNYAEAQEILERLSGDQAVMASASLLAEVKALLNDNERLMNRAAGLRDRRIDELQSEARERLEGADLPGALVLLERALAEALHPKLGLPKEVDDLIKQLLELRNLHTDQNWVAARQLIEWLGRTGLQRPEVQRVRGLAEQWIHWARQRDQIGALLEAIRHEDYDTAVQMAKEYRAEYPHDASLIAPRVKRELSESVGQRIEMEIVAARQALQEADYELVLKHCARVDLFLKRTLLQVQGLLPDQDPDEFLGHYQAPVEKLRAQAERLQQAAHEVREELQMAWSALERDDLAAASAHLDSAIALDPELRARPIREEVEQLRRRLADCEGKRLERVILEAEKRLEQAGTDADYQAIQRALEELEWRRLSPADRTRAQEVMARVLGGLDALRRSQELVQMGRKALDAEKWREAVMLFEDALHLRQDNKEAQTLLRRAQGERDRQAWLEAVVGKGQALLRAQKYEDAAVRLGDAVSQTREWGGELASDRLVPLLHAAEAGAKLESGLRHLSDGKYEKAESDVLQALTLSKGCEPAAGIAAEAQELLPKIRAKATEFRDREETYTFLQEGREALNDGDIEAAILLLKQAESILARYSRTGEKEVHSG